MDEKCICSMCGEIFWYNDAIIKSKTLYGILINEKVCPNCGSIHYCNIKDIDYLDKFYQVNTVY